MARFEGQVTEQIGALRFAIWAPDTQKVISLRPSRAVIFFVGLGLMVVGLLAEARGEPIGTRNVQPLLIYGSGLMLFGLTSAITGFLREEPDRGPSDVPPKPEAIPRHALPVTATVRRGGSENCRSAGWTWIEDGFLYFEGDKFACRITRSAVRNMDPWQAMKSPQGLRMDLPKGLPRVWLRLVPALLDDLGVANSNPWRALRPEFEKWRSSSRPASDSIFPPIRSGSLVPSRLRISGELLGLAVFVGSIAVALIELAPTPEARTRSIVPSVFTAATIGVFVAGLALAGAAERRRLDRQVDKVQGKLKATDGEAVAQ